MSLGDRHRSNDKAGNNPLKSVVQRVKAQGHPPTDIHPLDAVRSSKINITYRYGRFNQPAATSNLLCAIV